MQDYGAAKRVMIGLSKEEDNAPTTNMFIVLSQCFNAEGAARMTMEKSEDRAGVHVKVVTYERSGRGNGTIEKQTICPQGHG